MDKQIPKEQQRRESIRRVLRIAVPGALAAGAVGWLLSTLGASSVSEKTLQFSTADTGDIDVTVSATGRVVPAFEEIITSPITSRIVEVRHRAGDVVEAGTPLLLLDLHAARTEAQKQADMLRMKNLELQQQIAGDNTALGQLEMNIRVGDMKVRRLEAELRNEIYLDSIGSGTTDKVREAQFALRSAELELEQLRRQLEDERTSRRAAVDVKRLEIEIMAKEADMAGRTLGDAEIRAPRRATVTSITDKKGQQVSQGQEVAVIADLGHYRIDAEAAESYARTIKPGNTVTVRIGSMNASGTVSAVSPTAVNGTIGFTVTLDNDSIERLRPGLRPDVYVSQELRPAVTRIANGPYYNRPGKYSLFVRDGDELHPRAVQLGEANMDYVEVISGLEPGESVVITDMGKFNNKQTIKISQ